MNFKLFDFKIFLFLDIMIKLNDSNEYLNIIDYELLYEYIINYLI